MSIVKKFAAAAAALALVVSLAGCQFASRVADDLVNEVHEQGVSESPSGAGSSGAAPFGGQVATVVRVVDGDTIAVHPDAAFPATNESGTEHVIRLLSIDTPEMNKMGDAPAECGAQAALDYLAGLLGAGDEVAVIFDSRADQTDRYGRSLAYVQLADGTDVALSMVRDGFAAAWYPQGEPEPERYPAYVEAQQAAASSNAGAHASCDSIGR